MSDFPHSVPVFNCIVYVRSGSPGEVHARVANLTGLEASAPSEREALAKLVAAFKMRVAELTREQTPIPWIDPTPPLEPEEQERLIPVHL